MRTNTVRKLALAGFGLMGIAVSAFAMAGNVYVIAHPSVELTQAELKEVYLGEKQFAGSVKLVPVDNSNVQSDFLEKALNMDPSKYASLWIKKGFRGGLAAPEIKSGDVETIKFVSQTPGAIGYVGKPAEGVKLLQKY